MHLQQTKDVSRKSGGPQYYFHSVPTTIKEFLRKRGACDLVLQTPYGIVPTPFKAVSRDCKIDANGRIVHGLVGHDRIQQAGAEDSIGEAIRDWFSLPTNRDFERIDVSVELHPDGHFILSPLRIVLRGRKRAIDIPKPYRALSFHHDLQSPLWKEQIKQMARQDGEALTWIHTQVRQVVEDHKRTQNHCAHEADLLRVAGALSILGMDLSAYLTRGYDCPESRFQFLEYPEYHCPIEIKKRSSGFKYQSTKYYPLPRAVVLCLQHDLVNPPEHVDVVELQYLTEHLGRVRENGGAYA